MDGVSYDIAVSYFIRGEFERAGRLFEALVGVAPADNRCRTYLGMCYAHLGRAAEAEQTLSKAIELGAKDPQAWFHLGVARALRAEWPRAVSAYRHAVALAPEDMVAWHRLGVALAESGDSDAASTAFERSLVLSRETGSEPLEEPVDLGAPDDHLDEPTEEEAGREAKSWLDLALSLLSLGEQEEAEAAYERAAMLDPDRAGRSLFRPMLTLMTSASEQAISGGRPLGPGADRRPGPAPSPDEPNRHGRPPGEYR